MCQAKFDNFSQAVTFLQFLRFTLSEKAQKDLQIFQISGNKSPPTLSHSLQIRRFQVWARV